MGIRYRKSINLGGGFRVNISKSGIGYSWGVPGYRITKTSKGKVRRTYSVPRTGISYTSESSGKTRNEPPKSSPRQETLDSLTVYENIDIANLSELKPAEFSELIDSLEKSLFFRRVATILCFGLLGIMTSNFILSLIGISGIILKLLLAYKWTPFLEYTLDEAALNKFDNTVVAITKLQTCNKIWNITAESSISNRKVNAGASRNIKREPFNISTKIPNFMKTNIDSVCIILKNKKIIFLPDKIFIVNGLKIGIASYEDLQIEQGDSRFIESEHVPSDAEILGYTWQYVNKDGSPDKRFNNNRKLPICNYGKIVIKSGTNLNIELICSDNTKSKIFYEEILN